MERQSNNLPPLPRKAEFGEWCGSCSAACCQENTVMALGADEALLLGLGQDALYELTEEERVDMGLPEAPSLASYYVQNGPCIQLDPETNACMVYDRRPTICREFVPGSTFCRAIRVHQGLSQTPPRAHAVDVGMPQFPLQA